jgi:hypothetical protein
MAQLPITRMTLYKHGVGFFERRATLSGEEVELSFRVTEMNDILKSLTAIDWGGGQILGVDYATPQSREERLAGCSIRLDEDRSLRDLLASLRGRRVELFLDQDETVTGKLLGLDEPAERHPLASALVSLLLDEDAGALNATVRAVALERVQAVDIRDERGAADLRFFLQTSLTQDEYRSVTVRMSPGEHDLAVSYIAPAPTWRVSYRLVLDPKADGGPTALLLGWGIFDNRLEEDLESISLALVAGMPISFVYDLYTPFTPERPEVKEEARVAAAPVDFEEAVFGLDEGMVERAPMAMSAAMMPAPAPPMQKMAAREAMAAAQTVTTKGEALGELFQYVIQTPVTVGRGQSAMAPVVSAELSYQKDLLYNGRKMPAHPVATLRMKNASGLTLERGPVTVLNDGDYVGEAVLPFTAVGGEVVVPYAVELSAKITESSASSREIYRLFIKGGYLHFEEWDVRRQEYRLSNQTAEPVTVLVEHPRLSQYELFETTAPKERTDAYLRFEIVAPAWGENTLKVQERRLMSRYEEVQKQSHQALQRYLKQGLLDRKVYDQVSKLLMLYETIADYEKQVKQLEVERSKIYKAQQQVQGNMQALSQVGKEGALRTKYVEQLETTETQLRGLEKRETELKAAIKQVEDEIAARLKALG